jgi:hypothetical protein
VWTVWHEILLWNGEKKAFESMVLLQVNISWSHFRRLFFILTMKCMDIRTNCRDRGSASLVGCGSKGRLSTNDSAWKNGNRRWDWICDLVSGLVRCKLHHG